tara:strand:+ start:2062 stop:2736 length:675 start_codon:yes stop_codon:yes gene_type:complete
MDLPQACLFDLDGVLLDTEHLHGQAWFQTAQILGAKLSDKQLITLKGRRRFDCAIQITKWIEKTISVSDLLEIHKPISKKLMENVEAMSGAENLIKWCFENKFQMALVTSSTSSSVALKSKSHLWLKLIKTRVYGDDILLKKGKPSPDPFLLAASKLMVNPKRCWALEDSISGTKSALEAGCQVWVLDRNSNESALKDIEKSLSNPFRVNHLNEILKLLKRHKV